MRIEPITTSVPSWDITPLLPRANPKPNSIVDILPMLPKPGNVNDIFNILTTKLKMEWILIQYKGIGIEEESEENYERYLQYPNSTMRALALSIVNRQDTNDKKMYKIEQWVQKNITYQLDEKTYRQSEYWALPTMTLNKRVGDCIATFEEIYTESGLKRVKDIEIGDKVLSYDFDNEKFVYKPIVKIWEKGFLPAKKVTFKNGSSNVLTGDHPMVARVNQQGKSKYKKIPLSDIDMTRWWRRKIPIAKKIPYKVSDVGWLTEDLCFVLGHFLAEGWYSSKVGTSGYDIPEHIVPILDAHSIPYSLGENGSGVPQINFLRSEFKDFLSKQKSDSFNIHIERWILKLPESKLRAVMNGHFIGDGHNSQYPDKRGYKSNKELVHSTSSYRFAQDLQQIALQLGFSFHTWRQVFHGGAGDKKDGRHPIYRLTYNPNSYFLRNYGYEDISEVSIKFIADLPKIEMRDFEVEGTHNFICKNGNIYHNCEDGAFLMHSIALHAGIPADQLRTYGGLVWADNYGITTGGHAWTSYKRETDDEWILVDWCYWPTDEDLSTRAPMKTNRKYIDDWFYVERDRTVESPYANYVRNPVGMYAQQDKGLLVSTVV